MLAVALPVLLGKSMQISFFRVLLQIQNIGAPWLMAFYSHGACA